MTYKTPTIIANHKYSWLFGNEWLMIRRKDGNSFCFFIGTPGCQPAGSKVLMANGEWKNIEDIKVGDKVISPQHNGKNKYATVKEVSTYFSQENYAVIQLNREHRILYTCSKEHKIPMYCKRTFKKTINGKRKIIGHDWKIKHYEAKDLSNIPINSKNHCCIGFSSFLIENFLDKENCIIEPYSLGAFLGDGCFFSKKYIIKNLKFNEMKRKDKLQYHTKVSKTISITSADEEIIKEISKHYPIRYIQIRKGNKAKSYYFSLNGDFVKQLTKYGLEGKDSSQKFIPKAALLSNSEYRKKLLAGLIDTDGYYAKNRGGWNITTKSNQLAKDILFLVYSLGGRGNIKKVNKTCTNNGCVGEYNSVSIYLHDLELPLLVKRKCKDVTSKYLSSNRIGINLKKSFPTQVYGFELDSESQWYITDNFMVTHNSGKTYAALRRSEILGIDHNGSTRLFDPDHLENHLFFDKQDLLNKIAELEKLPQSKKTGYQLILDEAQMTANAKEWNDKQVLDFSKDMTTIRSSRFSIALTMPTHKMITTDLRQLGTYQVEMKDPHTLQLDKGISHSKLHLLSLKAHAGEVWRRRPFVTSKTTHIILGLPVRRVGLLGDFTWELPSKTIIRNYEYLKSEFRKITSENKAVRKEEEANKVNKKSKFITALEEARAHQDKMKNEYGEFDWKKIMFEVGVGNTNAYRIAKILKEEQQNE